MKTKIQQRLYYLFRECLLILCTINIPLLVGCSDDNEMGIINPSQKNIIRLSIPDAELVQVRSVANESECKISGIQVFVYNDSHTSSPVYYQEGTTDLSFLFGNGTASPTVTLKEYIPADKERIYVVCNLTNRSSVSGTGNFLVDETVSEEQLRNYTSQGLIKGISNLKDEGQSIPMYGWMEWNEKATSNVCLLTRCLAKITVDAAADLFTGKQVYWEWKNLNYSDFVLDSEHQGGIYQGSINEEGISEKHDLLSATVPLDEVKGLVTSYYPLEYKHSVYALGNEVDEKTFCKDRSMLLLTVQNPDGSNKEYYRLDFWDKETGKYLDIVRNHAYRFNITKLKSKGYTSAQEAIQNPGSNIEYTITVSDKWTQGFNSNGQYLVKMDREEIRLLQGTITDPVIMLKIELQADDAGNVNLDNVTTRKVRLLGKDKEVVSRFFIQTFYSTDNEHLIPIDNEIAMDPIPSYPGVGEKGTGNECELLINDKYWIYATVIDGSVLMPTEGFLELSIGNMVKYIPFSIIPHTEVFPVDDDGPANCFITPVTYGAYSFDATVIGNGADGIVAETRWCERGDAEGDFGQILGDDVMQHHFKDALGNDISIFKNVTITPKSAKLIWQDKENVISQVALNTTTNRVEFLSHDAGNGVIAVYDNFDPNAEDAKVLWSWHIWCTDKPDVIEVGLPTNGEVYSGKNYKIMDRDLGATTTTPDELTTCGLGYQWGRKDPFIGAASLESESDAPMYNVRGYKLDLKVVEKTETIGSLEYVTKHPDVFIVSDENMLTSEYDWLYYTNLGLNGNQYLWGNPFSVHHVTNIGIIMKTIYDPCPVGYKVPPQDVYGAMWANSSFENPKLTKYGVYLPCGNNGKNNVYFISASTRWGTAGQNGNDRLPLVYNGLTSGTAAYTSSSGSNAVQVLNISIKPNFTIGYGFNDVLDYGYMTRSMTGSVRCVRDE